MINSSERNAQRIRLTVFVILLIVLCLGSFWILRTLQQTDETHVASKTTPDYFIEDFRYVRMAETGKPRYMLSGKRMVHIPAESASEISQPLLQGLEKPAEVLTLKANRAIALDDQSKIHMYGNAEADRITHSASTTVRIRSDYLLLLPNEDIVRTDQPVRIMTGSATVTSKGMIANNGLQELRLLSQVRGTYQQEHAGQ